MPFPLSPIEFPSVNPIEDPKSVAQEMKRLGAFRISRLFLTPKAISASYTLSPEEDRLVLVTTSTSTITLTLPLASSADAVEYIIKKVDSGTGQVDVTRAGSDTIDGATSVTLLSQYQVLRIASDGTSWHVTGAYL